MGIVQTVTCDPAPSNIGNLGGAGDTGGNGHVCVASSLGFQAGNFLLGIGDTANFAGTTAVKWTDPANGDWQPLIHQNCRTAPGAVTDALDVILACVPITLAIAPGFVGKISASGAGSATVTNFDGTSPGWSVGQWNGTVCTEYSTGAGGTVSATTGGNTLAFSGGQTPPVGNPIVVGGFIKFVNTSPGEDFTAATVVEVSGLDATNPLIGYCSRQNVYAAAANLSTGTIPPWYGAALAISFGFDDEDNSAGPFNPLADTVNNVDDGVLWKWSLASAIVRMQHAFVTSPDGVYGMNFTAQGAGDHHMAFLTVLRLAATPVTQSGIILPKRRRWSGETMGLKIKEWW